MTLMPRQQNLKTDKLDYKKYNFLMLKIVIHKEKNNSWNRKLFVIYFFNKEIISRKNKKSP